jgi:hypothetical protein
MKNSEEHICRIYLCYLNMKIADRSFENVAKFRYLGMAVGKQNLIHEEIKSRLNSSNACCHSVQNFYLPVCCFKT